MAHLAQAVIEDRRAKARAEILARIEDHPVRAWYALMCPCNIDCKCMPLDEIPRVRLSFCLYPGEMDYFFTERPFLAQHNFQIRWHCDECHGELACGTPWLTE